MASNRANEKLFKLVKSFTPDVLRDITMGTISDAKAGMYPPDTPMGMYSLGELNATGAWWCSPRMIRDMCATVAARFVKLGLEACGVDLSEINPVILVNAINSTNAMEEQTAIEICAECKRVFGESDFDEAAINELVGRAEKFTEKVASVIESEQAVKH